MRIIDTVSVPGLRFDIIDVFLHGGVAGVRKQGKFSRILIQSHGTKITEK
jgi:hypothetical protein